MTTMNEMKKSIKRIFWLLCLLFFCIIGQIGKLVFLDKEEISTNAYNPRLTYTDNKIARGRILDNYGNVLAESKKVEETYQRVYPYGAATSHITGYTTVGKTGLEAVENFELQSIHHEVLQRISNVFSNGEVRGNDIVLTLDIDVQLLADELLNGQKGAAVVMEPFSGKIIAMASRPSFNPESVAEEWETIKADSDSPLLNRASQGLYPPGSIFKMLTSIAIMRVDPSWDTFSYRCTGKTVVNGNTIHCYNKKAHGKEDMYRAFALSCNSFFAERGVTAGGEALRTVADQFLFNQPIPFSLETNQSSFPLDGSADTVEVAHTAIGQGRIGVSPLHMAVITAAIANKGPIMAPYLIDHVRYGDTGQSIKTTIPQKLGDGLTAQEAEVLTDMMMKVVSEGTGKAAAVKGVTVAGKSGTAENAGGADHSWFVAFAPADNPKVVVSVVLENASKGKSAAPIAGKLIQKYFEKVQP